MNEKETYLKVDMEAHVVCCTRTGNSKILREIQDS